MVNLNELLKGIFSNDFENKTKLDLAFDFSDQFPIADFLKQRIKIKLQTINVSQVTLNVGTQSLTCTKIKKNIRYELEHAHCTYCTVEVTKFID